MRRNTSERLPTEETVNSMGPIASRERTVFENQPELIKASDFCKRYGYSMKTIYEWKYRPKRNRIPEGLVVKFRGKLFIRTDILGSLIASTISS